MLQFQSRPPDYDILKNKIGQEKEEMTNNFSATKSDWRENGRHNKQNFFIDQLKDLQEKDFSTDQLGRNIIMITLPLVCLETLFVRLQKHFVI